jgi:molybdenum cofactor guanylyltransferase
LNSAGTEPVVRFDISGAILAGGASRRMGADKALLRLADQTLLERVIATVAHVVDDVIVIGDRPPYRRYGVPVVADDYPDAGSLGGIATALRHARHEYVLVVACDMPLLSVALLRAMADVTRDYDALVPVTETARNRQVAARTHQTLHAIYGKPCLPPFERRIQNGDLKIVAALADVRVRALNEAWLRRYDAELESFVNANDPAEWAAVMARLEETSSTVEDRE